MAEPTQKELLVKLTGKVDHIISKQEDMKTKQDNMDLRLHDIQIDISGTSSEPERGITFRLRQAEKCIATIKKKQYRIFVWGIVIFSILGLAFQAVKLIIG